MPRMYLQRAYGWEVLSEETSCMASCRKGYVIASLGHLQCLVPVITRSCAKNEEKRQDELLKRQVLRESSKDTHS